MENKRVGSLALYLDTNAWVRSKDFVSIDWCGVLGIDRLTIVIAYAVLEETDDLKDDPKLKRQAEAAIRRLEQLGEYVFLREGKQVSPTTWVRVLSPESDEEAEKLGRRFDNNDERIIASALRHDGPEDSVELGTFDFNARVRAGARKLMARALPPDLKAADDDDQTRLRRELDRQKNARPKLKSTLALAGGEPDQPLTVVLKAVEPLSELEERRLTHKRVNALKNTNPPPEPKEEEDWADQVAKQSWFSTMGLFESFGTRYAEYLRERRAREEELSRTFRLCVVVENSGNSRANNVHCEVTFPDGIQLRYLDQAPRIPKEPSPFLGATSFDVEGILEGQARMRLGLAPPGHAGVTIRGHVAELELGGIMHKRSESSTAILVTLPPGFSDKQIKVQVIARADEVIDPRAVARTILIKR